MEISERATRRFWEKVSLPDANGCLVWLAGRMGANRGYGQFWTGERGVVAHKFAWRLAGYDLPAYPMVLDHRVCSNGLCVNVDHLQVTTQADNVRRCKVGRDNTSGYKGVGRNSGREGWRAKIRHEGKVYHLGYFSDPEDAARAYDRAALEMFGDAALTNEMLGLIA